MLTRIIGQFSLFATLLLFAGFIGAAAEPMAPYELSIEQIASARIGDNIELRLINNTGSELFGKFKIVLGYDPNRLTLKTVERGFVPAYCNWDDFGWQYGDCGTCGLKVVEIWGEADVLAIPGGSTCLSPVGEFAKLKFKISTDTLNAGFFADLAFIWIDCNSNTLESAARDTTFHGRFAFDQDGNSITGADRYYGGTLPGCIVPGEPVQIKAINTTNGGVQISPSFGRFGDANGDGRVNLSDVTYMINYIFADGSVPKDYLTGDYDEDGIAGIADAVFLLNYVFQILSANQ